MLSRNESDFIFGTNGHAGLSNRKAAELLKVQHTSVDDSLKPGVTFTDLELELIATQGFQGGVLVKLAKRFARSPFVKAETREHCLDFLEKVGIVGAQTFINKMAGVMEPKDNQPLLLPEQRLDIGIRAIELFGIDKDNPRFAQGLKDWCMNLLLSDKLLPESSEQWLGVAERAEELGYGRVGSDLSLRTRLGSFVGKVDLERKREERLCNGTTRKIWVYKVCQELDDVICDFFKQQ
jgi:hypothetical protein